MKKNRLLIISLLFASQVVLGQNPFTEFKLGFLSPSGSENGIFFGVNSGRMLDEAVSFSLSLDMYTKQYTKEAEVYDPNDPARAIEVENSHYYFPVLAKLNYERNLQSGLVIRGSGGIGWGMMWVNENNYLENVSDTRFYSGFAWRVGGGAGMQISSTSNLFVDIEYNGNQVSRSRGENSQGLPTRAEIDMSGLSLRIGISIFNLGF
jgi:opacity protein-like surface antigen